MKEAELNKVVTKIKDGDSQAFGELYDAYSAALYGICLQILKDDALAEDVLQDSFVKIWKNMPSFDEKKGSVFTWMLNITRNTAIDKYRQRAKKATYSIQNNENIVLKDNGSDMSINTNHIGLVDLLETLPEEQQQIVDYLYFKGYTQQETADELDLPLGTVKSRSRSALKALGELFILLLTWM